MSSWKDLTRDILEEFASDAFTNVFYEDSARARQIATVWQAERRQLRRAEDRVLNSEAHKTRLHHNREWKRRHKKRERLVKAGKCARCYRPRVVGIKLCQYHREITLRAQALQRARRKGMEVVVSATKHRLPETRAGVTHHFTIYIKDESSGVRELDGYIQTGEYEDGRLGEIFVRVGKPGSTEAWLDQWALGASLALQHGVPLEVYFAKFQGQRFEPSGATKNPDIPRCTSIIDYVARYVLRRYSTQGSP